MNRSKQKQYRGSRKHVLDWTAQPSFLAQIAEMIRPATVDGLSQAVFMPTGYAAPDEARLESFGPIWLAGSPAWQELTNWWLKHTRGANTPNWDIAIGCRSDDRPSLVLVEAKANWPELSRRGKDPPDPDSVNSQENHRRIGAAISEANDGWKKLDSRISISRDSHYQLANRLAFAWKLSQLGIPVVLMYLGFTGDDGIRDAGEPFFDDDDWNMAFESYISGAFPAELLDRRLEPGSAPVWVLSRSRRVIELSPEARRPD